MLSRFLNSRCTASRSWLGKLSAGLIASSLMVSGCSDQTVRASTQSEGQVDTGSPVSQSLMGMIAKIQRAPHAVAYQGVRRVDRLSQQPPIAYRETVAGDGQGGFEIEPINLLTTHHDPDGFLEQQRQMKGFEHRYGGFRIQDAYLFQMAYKISILSQAEVVAGIACTRLHVEKNASGNQNHIDTANHFLVDFDPQTGLVLQWEEIDVLGNRIAHSAFESIVYGAPTVAMHTSSIIETDLELSKNLALEDGFEALRPTLLPRNFRLHKASLVDDGSQQWIRQVYTDGLDTLLLMHGSKSTGQAAVGAAAAGSSVGALVNGDRTVLMGTVNGVDLIAEGKMDPDGLKEFVSSCWN